MVIRPITTGGALRRHAHEDGLPDPLALVAPRRAQAELHSRWVENLWLRLDRLQ